MPGGRGGRSRGGLPQVGVHLIRERRAAEVALLAVVRNTFAAYVGRFKLGRHVSNLPDGPRAGDHPAGGKVNENPACKVAGAFAFHISGPVTFETLKGWADLLDELLALRPNDDGTPVDLPMTAAAKAIYVEYVNQNGKRRHQEENELMRAAMSKLEGATARFALMIQLASDPQSVEVGEEAMQAGVTISAWFESQARRVYHGETAQERDRREVCEWIRENGGKTTRRGLARNGPGRFRQRAREVLADLEAAGLAKRIPRGHGSDEYVLCDCDSCDGEAQ